MRGQIELTLRDKATNQVLRRESVYNDITDIWTMRSLMNALQVGTPFEAMRSASRPVTGQYSAPLAVCDFGIYAMSSPTNVNTTDIIPPYVDNSHAALNDNVVFYNVNNTTIEGEKIMIAVDNRSHYGYDPSNATFTCKYVKNSGEGTVASIIFGRAYNTPHGHQGLLLGERQPGIHTTGTINYFLEHKVDRSLVWKTVSPESQFSFDLLTKQPTTFVNTILNTNIANAAVAGGLVMGQTVAKVTQLSSEASGLTVRLSAIVDFQTSTIVQTRDIVWTGTSLNTARLSYPVLVARPDTGAYEIFVPMEIASGGVTIKKATVTGFAGGLSGANVAITDVTSLPFLIGVDTDNAVGYYCTGYYDVAKNHYWLPYNQYVNPDNSLTNVQVNDLYQPGIVLNATDNSYNVVRHYLARTQANPHLPVLTDEGILQCECASAAMNYFWGSGVISGAHFTVPFVKTPSNILEVVYKYILE